MFSGGYVGVDVFFVISGYLITSIILSEQQSGRFSLAAFYERRARRILPALFFIVFACLPFSWTLLTPDELRSFAKSVIGVSTFTSNFHFWGESGYFDTDAELKPLLHTWSLAVEEQYYIFFPLLLMLLHRVGRQIIPAVLAMLVLGSFAFCGVRREQSISRRLLPVAGPCLGAVGGISLCFVFKAHSGTACGIYRVAKCAGVARPDDDFGERGAA